MSRLRLIPDAPVAGEGRDAPAAPPPRWLLAGALAFWGWHSGLWWVALPLLLLAELPRWVSWRFALAPKERQRVADLCTVLVALVGVWFALREPRLGAALIELIRWLPVLLFPLLAVQLYDERQGLPLSVLFLSLRGPGKPAGEATVDLRWVYLVLCVIAAAMVRPDAPDFLPSLALLAGYALWPAGAARAGTPRRLAALALAALLAAGLAVGLRAAHDAVELQIERWLEAWFGLGEDPFRATTALGDVGRVKASDRLRLRVYAPADARPMLLATAGYDRFVDDTWFTSAMPFAPLARQGDTWRLATAPANAPTTRLLLELSRPEGLLPLPPDAAAVVAPSLSGLERNGFGATRFVHRGPPRLKFQVQRGGLAPLAPPDAADLRVPAAEAAALGRFIEGAGLAGLAPGAAMARLEQLFAEGFRYTLDLPPVPAGSTAVGNFLLNARAGHCEYFATSAALVLRDLGLPTRYVRGWSVQEWSDLEGAWIVRDRHAHAWVQVWLGGVWQTFDPTPPDWGELEAAARPWTVGLGDRIAWLRLVLSGGATDQPATRTWLLLPLAALVLVLGWRIARRGRRRAVTPLEQARGAGGVAHPFVALEQRLARDGLGRRPGETLWEWAARLRARGEASAAPLTAALALYYRARFDPNGLSAAEQAALARAVATLGGRAEGQGPRGRFGAA